MNNYSKIKLLAQMIQALCDKEFTGKLELNFSLGNFSSVVKTEKVQLIEKNT